MATEPASSTSSIGGIELHVLRAAPGWDAAVASLRDLYDRGGERAERKASVFAARFAGRRAAMVFDVVHSANRNYNTIVTPRVQRFASTPAARSLRSLAEAGPPDTTGFRRFEADAMTLLAAQLADFCDRWDLDDDEGCRRWATGDDPGLLHHLDPVIGHIKGIGLTLYRYLRMRAGADDIKPDRRVANRLASCGFPLFTRPDYIYVLALAAAADAALRPLALDQLLWFDT